MGEIIGMVLGTLAQLGFKFFIFMGFVFLAIRTLQYFGVTI
jgi:hypothetical protein